MSSAVEMPPDGDFCLGVAFGAGGGEGPVMDLLLEFGECGVGVGLGVLGGVNLEPAFGEAGREDGFENG